MAPMRRQPSFLVVIAFGSALFGALASAGAAGDEPSAHAVVPKPVQIVKAGGAIRNAVERYRALLGPDNGGAPVSHASGRREINWDGVPDEFARPNLLPADFFNAATTPRARGAVLRTPGAGVAVSADSANPAGTAVLFGDVNATYPRRFRTFSPERLFSPIGSNVVNLQFFVPGTKTPAAVRGFGAVYTDIDRRENTAFEYFDTSGRSLGKFNVPPRPRGLSFLGVVFRRSIVARVRIRYGSHALGPNDTGRYDVAVMDDFIYGEPQKINR